ncbi:DUF748 domain-containing protein, partial [Parasulfuritortus cantonensis]
ASSLLRFAWTFDTIRLTGPEGRLVLLPGGKLNWTAFLDAFKDDEEKPDKGMPRLLIRHLVLQDGRVDFVDRTVAPAFETGFRPLDLSLDELSTLPDDKGRYQVSARTPLGAQLRWQGEVALKPVSLSGAVSLTGIRLARLAPYLKGRVDIAAPEGIAGVETRYRVGYDNKHLSLALDQIGASVEGLRLAGARASEPALALDKLSLSGGRFDLDRRSLQVAAIELNGGRVNLARRADGSLDVQDWLPAAPAAAAEVPAPATAAPAAAEAKPAASGAGSPWHVALDRFSLDGVGVHFVDHGYAKPLALDVGNVKVTFKADALAGAGPLQAHLADGGVELARLAVASAGKPLAGLDRIALAGVRAGLAEHRADADSLTLSGGRLAATRAANGRITLLDALAPASARKPAPARARPRARRPGRAGPGAWGAPRWPASGWPCATRRSSRRSPSTSTRSPPAFPASARTSTRPSRSSSPSGSARAAP